MTITIAGELNTLFCKQLTAQCKNFSMKCEILLLYGKFFYSTSIFNSLNSFLKNISQGIFCSESQIKLAHCYIWCKLLATNLSNEMIQILFFQSTMK